MLSVDKYLKNCLEPIESAHRMVIQKRMKLSGRQWSKIGAQHMLNLTVTAMNDRWDKIIQMVTAPKSQAA